MRSRFHIILFSSLAILLVLTMAGCGPAATPEAPVAPEEPEEPVAPEPTAPPPEEEPAEPVVMRFGWRGEPDCLTNIYTCGTIYFLSELIHDGWNGIAGCRTSLGRIC